MESAGQHVNGACTLSVCFEVLAWQARVAAVMGSCPLTRASFKSGRSQSIWVCPVAAFACVGIRSWGAYAVAVHGSAELGWPPQMSDIIGWSHTFRCVGTFTNYVGHVRTACMAMGLDAPDCCDAALKKAKTAIVKRMLFTARYVAACFLGCDGICKGTLFVKGHACSFKGAW